MTRPITPHKGGRTARIPGGRIRPQTLDRILAEKRERKMSFADLVEERWQGDDRMSKKVSYKQYLNAQDKLSECQNRAHDAQRELDQNKLDKATQDGAKWLAIIAAYKAQKHE